MTIFDVVASNMLVALESGGASAVTAADWASVISAMTAQISVATIVGVMATIVAACIGIRNVIGLSFLGSIDILLHSFCSIYLYCMTLSNFL